MDSHGQETLRRVEENDADLTTLWICGAYRDGIFISTDGDDYSRLGAAVGENTHLTSLVVVLDDAYALDVANDRFYDGLKLNSSFQFLHLHCQNSNLAGGVGQKILEAYQENNSSNLTEIRISGMGLQNEGDQVIATTLRRCTNLNELHLQLCNITNEQLLPMMGAVREHRSLEEFGLSDNRIGNNGCDAIATLLEDPNSNLHSLNLTRNVIGNEGASTLANGLANNTKLRELYLGVNQVDQSGVDIFSKLLCDVSSINSIYSSNHTLEKVVFTRQSHRKLEPLLDLNKCNNKSRVAIRKILKYHSNIDMEPFFEWNMEGEGERNLKALPYMVAWFDRAGEAVAGNEGEESYNIGERKLSALYQFAQAMPLLFVPVPHNKRGDNKRKRNGK